MKKHSIKRNIMKSESFTVEYLSVNELSKIKGGSSDGKSKSKETDVYDLREV